MPNFLEKLAPESSVKKVIGIVSGKGGVGKSMVTSLMACKMRAKGYRVGILDADITGPSIPKAFGIHEMAYVTPDGRLMIPAQSSTGIEIMSANMILDNETEPVIWRGPIVAGVVKQFWNQTLWKDIDYMFVDMPPGTGDVPLTVFQSLPVDGPNPYSVWDGKALAAQNCRISALSSADYCLHSRIDVDWGAVAWKGTAGEIRRLFTAEELDPEPLSRLEAGEEYAVVFLEFCWECCA